LNVKRILKLFLHYLHALFMILIVKQMEKNNVRFVKMDISKILKEFVKKMSKKFNHLYLLTQLMLLDQILKLTLIRIA